MNPNRKLLHFLSGSAFLALTSPSYPAARYWDAISPATSPASGGTGTWSQTGNNWRTLATNGTQTAYGTGTAGQQAFFAGTVAAPVVTVSGTVYIAGVGGGDALTATDGASNYTFDGTGGGIIQLSAAGNIRVNTNEQFNSNLTINNAGFALGITAGGVFDAKITGGGAVNKTGNFTVLLNNPGNDYTGGTTVTSGTLGFVSGGLGTVGGITVNGGTLRWETGNIQDLSPRIVMQAGGNAIFNTDGNDVPFASAVGSSTTSRLTKEGAGTLTLSANNTYTGDTLVNNGILTLSNTGGLTFDINANGVNNQISGTGAGTVNLGGLFTFDLTGASTTPNDSWNIVDVANLNETFTSSFSIAGFSQDGGGILWNGSANGADYQFSEFSGVLTVVPEPSAALLGGLGLLALLRRRR